MCSDTLLSPYISYMKLYLQIGICAVIGSIDNIGSISKYTALHSTTLNDTWF